MKLNDGRLVRVSEGGEIVAIEQTIKLKLGDQYITEIKGNPATDKLEERNIITAEGMSLIASTMGLSIITPDTIVSDTGVTVGNPHIERSRGIVTNVRQRVICFGRNSNGSLMGVDLTFIYNLGAYLHTDLFNKFVGWEQDKASKKSTGKKWGKLVSHCDPPEPGKIRVPVAVDGLELEVEANHPDVLLIWREYQDKQKYAERTCHSMAVRNVIRKFTGIQYCNSDGTIAVTCWVDKDRDLDKIAKAILNTKIGRTVVDGEVVGVEQAVVSEDIEPVKLEDLPRAEEPKEEPKSEDKKPEPEAKPAEPAKEEKEPEEMSESDKLVETKAKVRKKLIESGYEKKAAQYPPMKAALQQSGMSMVEFATKGTLQQWEGLLASIVD